MNGRGAVAVLAWAACVLPSCTSEPARVPLVGGIEAVGLARTEDVRVVYQIKTGDMKEGVGAGLHYVKKLLDTYNRVGVPDEAVEVHAVLHGDAGHWMLEDEAHAMAAGDRNPNKEIVEELLRRGVSLELCAQTMQAHGWSPSDVLPGVLIVVGAYPRIIDLQLRGFAYIRF